MIHKDYHDSNKIKHLQNDQSSSRKKGARKGKSHKLDEQERNCVVVVTDDRDDELRSTGFLPLKRVMNIKDGGNKRTADEGD